MRLLFFSIDLVFFNIQVTKSNVMKDFVHIAGPYGISHFIVVSKTELSPYLVRYYDLLRNVEFLFAIFLSF